MFVYKLSGNKFLYLRASILGLCLMSALVNSSHGAMPAYAVVDSHQTQCFGVKKQQNCSTALQGQDAQYQGYQKYYADLGDGTVQDAVTGLIWSQSTDLNHDGKINAADKVSYAEAIKYIESLNLAGEDDWRLPSIKELYSLVLFDGQDPSGIKLKVGKSELIPFIDHEMFSISTGDTRAGERLIDSQFVSNTRYVSTTMHGDNTVFGVNFIDGRIKGYGMQTPDGRTKNFYLLAVRGNKGYGINDFSDHESGIITDQATGLIWQQYDSANAMNFVDALGYCENLSLAGKEDWRLPNVKELQSIVDYSRSPDTTNSAAIDPLFQSREIQNEQGTKDYGNYWSSTTHVNLKDGAYGAYVAFGRSTGYMHGEWLDVHGAGAQRSDPKVGDAKQFPQGHGPQGDSIRINNSVRCVRAGGVELINDLHASESLKQRQPMLIENYSDESTSARSPMVMLDKNADKKISKEEAKGPLDRDFYVLDENSDGFLTADEIPIRRDRVTD
ncbi:MAG: DUF1566 domain-containing protein [Oleispira sp.]